MIELASFRRATHIFTLVMKQNINAQLKITSAMTTFVNRWVGIQVLHKLNPSIEGREEKLNYFLKIKYLKSSVYMII